MAGALEFFSTFFNDLGIILKNWNSDPVALGAIAVLVLMVSGYFYGCVYRKFIPAFEHADTTFIGVFTIIGVFQFAMYFFVWQGWDAEYALILLMVLIGLGPLLVIFSGANIIPRWKNLFSFIAGIGISIVLICASAQWTVNSIYFDSVSYLSQTIESATLNIFARMDYNRGLTGNFIGDPLHDFNSYYYFWGTVLRWTARQFSVKGTLTPIYIWGATILYGMGLGNLWVSTVNVLYREKKHLWFGAPAVLLIMAPYYTNYWNTDLAFFGNTMRTLGIGYLCMIIYLILNRRDTGLFAAFAFVSLANIAFSSSALFLLVFISLGLFFALCLTKEDSEKNWYAFAASLFPAVHYGVMMLFPYQTKDLLSMLIGIAVCALLAGIVFLLRKHMKVLHTIGVVLLPVMVIALAAGSYLMPGEFGYDVFFESRSLHDMTVNMTSWLSQAELIRNIIFYVMLVCLAVSFRKETKYKVYLLAVILIGINPLVTPLIANGITANVYSRMFDILNNPFSLGFLVYNFDMMLKIRPLSWASLTLAGAYGVFALAIPNLTVPYSLTMTPKMDDFNWRYKTGEDILAMYNYVQDHLSIPRNGYFFISQNTDLKGFVSGVKVSFGAVDYRTVLENLDDYEGTPEYLMVTLLYPNRRYASENVRDAEVDYSRLYEILDHYNGQYLVISNTIAVWDERGWYVKSYQPLITEGICSLAYENESWALLKVNNERLIEYVMEHADDETAETDEDNDQDKSETKENKTDSGNDTRRS